jgi:hypothetical protein
MALSLAFFTLLPLANLSSAPPLSWYSSPAKTQLANEAVPEPSPVLLVATLPTQTPEPAILDYCCCEFCWNG